MAASQSKHLDAKQILRGFPMQQKARFFRELATLIESALPLHDAVKSAGKQCEPELTAEMSERLCEGESLGRVMTDYPRHFTAFEVNMVKAGETAGTLDNQLSSLASGLEKTVALYREMSSKLLYPILVAHAAVFVPPLVLLVTDGFWSYIGATLGTLIPIYVILGGTWAVYRYHGHRSDIRHRIDTIVARVPVLGAPFLLTARARFLGSLGQLLEAGLPYGQAIDISAGSCGNRHVGDGILASYKKLGQDSTIHQAMLKSGLFSGSTLSMVATGEETGGLPDLLLKCSESLNLDAKTSIHQLMVVLPVLMLGLVGIMVGSKVIGTMASLTSF